MLATYLQVLMSGLAVGGVYALIALSFSITFTTTKTLNFSQGEFIGFGAFLGVTVLYLLSADHGSSGVAGLAGSASAGLNYPIAALAVGCVTGVLGIVIFLAAIRPFSGKPGMSWVMSTIGFGVILQSIGLAVWGPAPVKLPSPFGDDVLRIAGAGVRPQEVLVFVTAVVLMVALDVVMRATRIGKAMRAVAHNPAVASLMGINVTAVMIGAFVLSSALAGLGGVLVAPIASASLFMGLGIALKAFSGAIMGGLDNPRGCIFGGFALGLLEQGVALWQAQWREIVIFALIILVLSVWPNGLFGSRSFDKV
ncbi:branched-chain amino acid ABC transporter permease [Tardiphaga sp. vice352]|uniref:branched-chain amino acid ABC transporter permease n=1 Tax=unclassified Tardiphaga TaxID=2631404 RepID=UPI0011628577|nr:MULTISPECIES: branched-chain amino acid ABC transporter permease [unclassified Tardiphaga]QDM17182.1 branched-chain amino acid ABC transporter permease [Tardiphaga sp. vice278]QDM22165.1 branched-chain amino acid ABC transporter permease [Tardiphaga sp. vice154]QDM27419.1 branched-chain amino acid ABC transporter permease [Tardiphaga sp. vice304]QDM32545.1 branched-chain amino acid ABC transporter permease [Tardiphaga sp. vice352]